jgi:hypothetical protein
MRNATILWAMIAVIGTGVVAGLAVHPEARIPPEVDWRARYPAPTPSDPAPIVDLGMQDTSVWPDGIPPLARQQMYRSQPEPDYITIPDADYEARDDWRFRRDDDRAERAARMADAMEDDRRSDWRDELDDREEY